MLIRLVSTDSVVLDVTPEELQEALDSGDPVGFWDAHWSDMDTEYSAIEDYSDGEILWEG